ncbi:hypothetical protein OG311_13545 [Streptomyces sp. NBC_01343]|uniref:hypothetical protein n=1 Tax=Streptomyces sp. NBC_01343 TaxID=2903832 RepID=UPI002E0ED810|nr:hypothetical protein OG311_13545 [Streptomyces sp. NBC_01343]
MSVQFDAVEVKNNDGSLNGLTLAQRGTSGRGNALRVESDNADVSAISVKGAGPLLDLQNAAGVSQLTVSSTGVMSGQAATGLGGGAVSSVDMGYKSWAYDTVAAGTPLITTTATIYLARLQCRRPETWTNLHLGITAVGSTLTSSQNFVGLYNSAGTRVAVSADVTSTFAGTIGEKTIPFASPASVTPGFYWAAILCTGSTPVTLVRSAGSVADLGNAVVGAAGRRFGTIGTGTSLPASITPSSIAATTSNTYWVAIS